MSNPDERVREDAPQPSFQDVLHREAGDERTPRCEFVSDLVDRFVGERCARKHNQLQRCRDEGEDNCPCLPPTGAARRVDLVVLLDGSVPQQTATLLSAAIGQAVEQSRDRCPADLRVQPLVVDRARPGTAPSTLPGFGPSHEWYLNGIGVAGPFAHDAPTGGSPAQQGADAIVDISRYFNWRPGTCRAIYYVSAAPLDAGPVQDPTDVAARVSAVAQATAAQVAVFAHLLTPVVGGNQPAVHAEYHALCTGTGGSPPSVGGASQGIFVEGMLAAICRRCPPRCVEVRVPALQPCVSISWGDSRCDCMETDDTEVLCITVCNCYSNVTLSGLTIGFVIVTDGSSLGVPALPDGTPSVDVRPLGPLCFGDIPPCRDGRPGCVSREVVLMTRGARPGSYQVHLGAICYSATFDYQAQECFRLQLCRD